MAVILASRLSNDIPYRSTTNCINLPRCIPLDRMNYKDALNVTIDLKDKSLTRAKLVEIGNTLQDHCLVDELSQPEIIPMSKYYSDLRARMSIDKRERNAFIKDVFNLGRNTRDVLVTAMERL